MADDPNAAFYQHGRGSLTGFSQFVPADGGTDPVTNGWSIENLRAFLLNPGNFPTETQVRQINELIQTHIADHNNPHHVTLDQLDTNFVGEILGSVTPGTPPDIAPFFSYDSMCALPLGDVFPANYTSVNCYRMNEGGVLVDPATESEILGIDYITNTPGIPLFSAFNNVVPANWASQSSALVNTVLGAATARPGLPFNFYLLSETNNTGQFGIAIPVTEALSTVYTLTVFLSPTATGGSVVFSQPSDPTNNMTVSMSDGSCTFSSATVTGETFVYPNGVIRVAFSFISKNPTVDTAVNLIHLNFGDTTTARAGQASRPLFQVAYPTMNLAGLNQPVMVDPTQNSSTSTLTLGLNKIPAPTSMQNIIITLAMNLYPTLPGATFTGTRLLTFDSLTIERDATNIYVKSAGTTLFTSTILRGINVLSLSYSTSSIIFKDYAVARQTAAGSFPMLSTANVSAGPCGGYLQYMAFYATSDDAECVEYLSNG